MATPPGSWSGEVEEDSDGLAEMGQHGRSHVAPDADDSMERNSPDVLALSGRDHAEPVHVIGLDQHLGVE